MSSLFPNQQVATVPGNLGAGAGLSFAGGANPPSHAGDFTSSFSSFQQEDHPGKRTNEVSSVPIQVRPFKEGFERHVNVGDIVFNLLPSMSVFSAPSMAISEVLVNLPVLNMVLLGGAKYVNVDKGFPLYVGVHRNEMAMSGKESFVSNTDPHSRLFNVDVMGTTKIPNIWRGADYDKKQGTVRVGWRVGLGRFKVRGGQNPIERNAIGDAKQYTIDNGNAHMMLPVFHDKGKWEISSTLEDMLQSQFDITVGELQFTVDMGIVTWLGAEHGARDIAGAQMSILLFFSMR